MKNADMPAMPQSVSVGDDGSLVGSYMEEEWEGLTKREIFAMNAPDIPCWFIDDWIYNNGNYRTGGSCELAGAKRGANVDISEMMKITKEWRYAYADLMLGE